MENYESFFGEFNLEDPLENASFHVTRIEDRFNIKLPSDYVEFMEKCNGGEGFIGENYLILYPLNEIIEANEDYEVAKYLPNVLLIGSNGGGEAIAIDFNKLKKYIIVPFLFEEEAILEQSYSLEGFFLRTLHNEWFDA